MHHAARNACLLLIGALSRDRTDDLHDYWQQRPGDSGVGEADCGVINNRSYRCCMGLYAADSGKSKGPGGKVLGRQACQAIKEPLMRQVLGDNGCDPTNDATAGRLMRHKICMRKMLTIAQCRTVIFIRFLLDTWP